MNFPKSNASLHQLHNGLTLILDEDHTAPVISTQAWVETGSIHEGKYLGSGISHLLEHMVFKGTESFDSLDLSERVQKAGGQWNAYTSFDRTVYYMDGPSESVKIFLKVLTEMVFKPSLPKGEFEKEKDVIRREIDMGMDDPDDRNFRLLYSTIFTKEPRRYPVIGELDLFNNLEHEHLLDYYKQRYNTENVFICISGDFITEEILDYSNKLYENIIRASNPPVLIPKEPDQLGKRLRREKFSIPASKLTIAWRVPSLKHHCAPGFDLIANILGLGRSSRLYEHAREKLKLCHSISAWSMIPPEFPGVFGISAVAEHKKRDSLQGCIFKEIDKLIKDDLSSELTKAKKMIYTTQIKNLATASGRATDLALNWHETRNLNFTRDYLLKINSLQTGEIQKLAEEFLSDTDNLTITSLDPLETEESHKSRPISSSKERVISSTLSNGLSLVLERDSRLPVISFAMAFLTGLHSENTEISGINTLLSRLMPKGTCKRTASQIAHALDSMGASFDLTFGNNTTLALGSCLEPDFLKTMELVGDVIVNPKVPDAAIDVERDAIISALKEQAEDPLSVALLKLRSSLFGDKTYGLNHLGSLQALKSLSRKKLLGHHRAYFSSENCVLAICGDIDLQMARETVTRIFSEMPQGHRFQITSEKIDMHPHADIKLNKEQAILAVGYLGPSLYEEDHYALELIHDYCSDMSGPLFSNIREKHGLAYYVSSTQFLGLDTGMFAFYLGTSPSQLNQAKVHLLKEINILAKEGIPAEKLNNVKNAWLASHDLQNQKISMRARHSALDVLLGFPPDHYLKAPDIIRKLNHKQIQETANKYLAQGKASIISISPENNS